MTCITNARIPAGLRENDYQHDCEHEHEYDSAWFAAGGHVREGIIMFHRHFQVSALFWVSMLGLAASGFGQSQGMPSEYRTFRDAIGRSVQARVMRVDDDRVTLQRTDGKQFTVPIDGFSEADQQYLQQWYVKADSQRVSNGDDQRDWYRFRGPAGMGKSAATGLPVEWSQDEGLVWKTELPGAGASSPITFGNRVYVTAYTGYFVPGQPPGNMADLQRHLIELDLEDGRILWNRAVPAKLPEEESIRDHGFAANSVAIDQDRIYAFFGKTGVFAFDHQGNQLWQTDVGSQTSGWGSAASPVLYQDMVFINASVESESLVALDRATGEVRWTVGGARQPDAIREAWNTPLVVTATCGRQELVIASAGTV